MNRALCTLLVLVGLVVLAPRSARAQQSKEFLVPPSGGTYVIAVHPSFGTGIFFGEPLAKATSPIAKGYLIEKNGNEGLTVQPTEPNAPETNINFSTVSGTMRVSVVLHVVKDTKDAYTLVTFRPTSEEAARKQMIADAVAAETEKLRAALAKATAEIDRRVREQADDLLAQRLLQRHERLILNATTRNDNDVIVRVTEAQLIGDDGYVFFEVQNRSGNAYRVGQVQVLAGTKDYASRARIKTTATAAGGQGVIGVVAAGGRASGVVVLRQADRLLRDTLKLVTGEPGGRNQVVVGGIRLR